MNDIMKFRVIKTPDEMYVAYLHDNPKIITTKKISEEEALGALLIQVERNCDFVTIKIVRRK